MQNYTSTIDEIHYNEAVIQWCDQVIGLRSQLAWCSQVRWTAAPQFRFYVEFGFPNWGHKIMFDIAWGHTLTTVDTQQCVDRD